MEITLTATIFSFFGWNVYLLIKKYRERLRQNYLQNLIDQESDYLIMNVAPYKKIKLNEQIDKIIKPTQFEDSESSSDDYELIQYRRRKTILQLIKINYIIDEVKQEKFQEQSYILNTESFIMLNIPNKNNKEFSFTNQNEEIKQIKRFRKNSKINSDDSLPIESPKQTNKNSSNKVSEKKITQFEISEKDQFELQDSRQESAKCVTDLVSQFQQKQDKQSLEENKNVSLLFPVQIEKSNNQTKIQQNEQQGETLNIFGKFIVQADKEQQEQKQLSPQTQQQQPEQNNIGLFSNILKTTNSNLFQEKTAQPIQINQIPQVQIQNLNNGFQMKNNEQKLDQKEQQQQQQTSLFQNNNNSIPVFNLNNQNQDSLNKNCSNDTKSSNVIQNSLPSNFTFGFNQNTQTNSQGGLFGDLITPSNICQTQTNNIQNMCSSQPQQTQSNLIQPQPNNGTSLFGGLFSTQQPKEQSYGGLFNFSSNTQAGSNLFSKLQKN